MHRLRIATGGLAAILAGIALAAPTASGGYRADSERRYAGATLGEWRERIKNVDYQSSASEALVPGLMEIVRDREAPWVSRRQAAETLGRLGPRAADGVWIVLAVLDEPASGEVPPRLWGMKALALYGTTAKAAAPKLAAVLKETSRPLVERSLALEALVQVGRDQGDVLGDVIKLLALPVIDPDKPAGALNDALALRELAVETFTLLGPRGAPAIPALARLFEEPSDVLRMKVAQALGAMGPRAEIAVTMLAERILFDDSPLVRDAAADALAKIGGEAIPALTQLLSDRDEETRWRAASALGQMGRAARSAVDPLVACLDDDSAVVRIRAAEALWRITSDPKRAIPTAVETLTEPDRQLRIRAARLLASMGRRARPAIPRLRELSHDDRPAVRDAALKVLEKLGDK